MEQISQPKILRGLIVHDAIRQKLMQEVKGFFSSYLSSPKLVIIQVGEREDSNVYIKQKIKFGELIGVSVVHKKLGKEVTEEDLRREIQTHNTDKSVSGIIVQLPLPAHINRAVIESIAQEKDVDCLTEYHQKKLEEGDEFSAPATARAVLALIEYYKVPLQDTHVVVIGRSALVGKPTATLLKLHGAKVSVIHRQTEDPKAISRTADVLVVACGVPQFVTGEWIDPGKKTVVIDIGIHRIEAGLVGDVEKLSVYPLVSAISPVPGGVGPLTVASLFEQVVRMYRSANML